MASFNFADYETVDARVKRFRKDFPGSHYDCEVTPIYLESGKIRWQVKAKVWRDNSEVHPASVGVADEIEGTGGANKNAALENAETSALGRALANLGYSTSKRASREEMAKALKATNFDADIKLAKTRDDLLKIHQKAVEAGMIDIVLPIINARRVELGPADG